MNTKSPKVTASLIEVRDLKSSDIPHILDYWFRSPPGYLESMAVETSVMPTEAAMKEQLTKRLEFNSQLKKSKLNALVILYDRKPIGFHTLVPAIEGESGIFHAHIWQANMRGQGVGFYSYPKACSVFMERFNLKKIDFKTPIQNVGAIKVKEKLGIRCIAEGPIDLDFIKKGTFGKFFELSREEASQN